VTPSTVETHKDALRKRVKKCADCGSSCTGRRCIDCVRVGQHQHGHTGYIRGCRCDICAEGMRRYAQKATCVDCGAPCHSTRCRPCFLASRRVENPVCACGSAMDRESKQCLDCYRSTQTPRGAPRPGATPWARRANAAPGLNRRQRRALLEKWKRQNRTCAYCDSPCECVDHVFPLILGGTNYEGNLAPSCFACNMSKNDRPLSAWRHDIALKLAAIPTPGRVQKPLADPLGVQLSLVTCCLCGEWMIPLRSSHCSTRCQTEAAARSVRDLYRKRQGLPVDHTKPTKRWVRESTSI
jgi:hypothetical protein